MFVVPGTLAGWSKWVSDFSARKSFSLKCSLSFTAPATGANDPLFNSVRCARELHELHDRVVDLSGNIVALLIFVDCWSQFDLVFFSSRLQIRWPQIVFSPRPEEKQNRRCRRR